MTNPVTTHDALAHDAGAAVAQATPYERLGGDAGVRALVERFYDLMDLDPAFGGIRTLHAPSLDHARAKLHLFLSGWLGGPQVYIAKYGHPKLRARHLPFSIGIAERDQWLACMRRALVDTGVADDLAAELMPAFFQTADWMRNRP
jgi:hemoglobin